MGQDRQYNMTHGMGHVGYSRIVPCVLRGQWDRTVAWDTLDIPGIVPCALREQWDRTDSIK